jgi:hypothetical protein
MPLSKASKKVPVGPQEVAPILYLDLRRKGLFTEARRR